MTLPVTLVIPILNEAKSLPELLQAIKGQSCRPNEIFFSDAGSTDGSVALIDAWWQSEGWDDGQCNVYIIPGALPGAGRNAGVRAAKNNWIAFIDGGIKPSNDWLEKLYCHANKRNALAVFGVCHFSANTVFSKAVCALSYGHDAVHPVVPASLFDVRLFKVVGEFPPHLRAGEDLSWMAALRSRYGEPEICSDAMVYYKHFPTNWNQAFRKWRITELHCVLAGVRTRQQLVYLFGLPALYAIAWSMGGGGYGVFGAYLILRGVIDPVRRSPLIPWWGQQWRAALIAPSLAAALDIAKWLGIVQGVGLRIINIWNRHNSTR